MSFKKTLVVAALAFWAGTHYSPKFYEEVEKFEEDLGDTASDNEDDGAWTRWAYITNDVVRKKLLGAFAREDKPAEPLGQSEADKLYRFAFDKGWSAASQDKANVGKQYNKLFGPVTAEEVQSEMRGG
jgi:hypothetical protein